MESALNPHKHWRYRKNICKSILYFGLKKPMIREWNTCCFVHVTNSVSTIPIKSGRVGKTLKLDPKTNPANEKLTA